MRTNVVQEMPEMVLKQGLVFDVASPVGFWQVEILDDAVVRLDYLGEYDETYTPLVPQSALAQKFIALWQDYFDNKPVDWSQIPVSLAYAKGTEFQRKIWHALTNIAQGQTVTYKQLAEQIGSPKAFRAVGQAVGRNPIAILLPCHRVLGSDGRLCGFMLGRGQGLEIKQHLLSLEGIG